MFIVSVAPDWHGSPVDCPGPGAWAQRQGEASPPPPRRGW